MNTLITSTNLPRLIIPAILGALALSCGAVSSAADTSMPRVVVKFGDLNLSNPEGAAALYGRIAYAADVVCDSFSVDIRDHDTQDQVTGCVRKAIADAVNKVDRPELFAVYNGKNHRLLSIRIAAVQTH
ncbi:MAG: UrcA family protein [Steroidobacteraceae bacterium]